MSKEADRLFSLNLKSLSFHFILVCLVSFCFITSAGVVSFDLCVRIWET